MAIDTWNETYGNPGPAVPSNPKRDDFLVEGLFMADGSGVVTTDWFPTDGSFSVRMAGKFLSPSSPTVTIEEAQRDTSSSPRVIRSHSVSVTGSNFFQEIDLTGRVIRFKASGVGAAGYVAVTIRTVN